MNTQAKHENPTASLKAIATPSNRPIVSAPPILIASTHTVDYCCGNCGTTRLHAEPGQVNNLVIRCTKCGGYSSTDT